VGAYRSHCTCVLLIDRGGSGRICLNSRTYSEEQLLGRGCATATVIVTVGRQAEAIPADRYILLTGSSATLHAYVTQQ
jgi:hypothetical protein